MRQSRYVWLIGISLICLFTIVFLKTPQTVISTLADPQNGNSPRSTIQHFWNLMDFRQTNLAQELLDVPAGSSDEGEFRAWETKLNKDPLLSLQKVEFMNLDSSNRQAIVRISWTSPLNEVQSAVFSISLELTDRGWRITSLKRVNNFSSGEEN